jgi:hypothetical protein
MSKSQAGAKEAAAKGKGLATKATGAAVGSLLGPLGGAGPSWAGGRPPQRAPAKSAAREAAA